MRNRKVNFGLSRGVRGVWIHLRFVGLQPKAGATIWKCTGHPLASYLIGMIECLHPTFKIAHFHIYQTGWFVNECQIDWLNDKQHDDKIDWVMKELMNKWVEQQFIPDSECHLCNCQKCQQEQLQRRAPSHLERGILMKDEPQMQLLHSDS